MSSRIKILFGIFLTLASVRTSAQCYFAQADKFDNIWVIKGNEVICFDKQLKRIGSYSNILLGNPSTLDALDPFRIVVFYPSSQAVVILNNAVAEITRPIKLIDKEIDDACLVCRSSRGGFWVFDRTQWAAIHFDSGFNPTGEKNIPDMMFSNYRPLFMQEYQGALLVAFDQKGICRFDSFGARMGDIPVLIEDYFTIIDNLLVYKKGDEVLGYDLRLNEKKVFNNHVSCIPVFVSGKPLVFDGSGFAVNNF